MPGQSPESAALSRILSVLHPIGIAAAQGSVPEEESPEPEEEIRAPEEDVASGEASLTRRYTAATQSLAEVAPRDPALARLSAPGVPITSSEVEAVEVALRQAVYQRTCDFVRPDGKWIGEAQSRNTRVRTLPGGLEAAQEAYDYLSKGGVQAPFDKGLRVTFPGQAGNVLLRPETSTDRSPAVDVNVTTLGSAKLHYK